ncbi:MAG: hypothetical protein L0Y80_06475 [Ignavibacteriae bacterium]|nr:hypothetical protein [Ignavibacteriota bacterium]
MKTYIHTCYILLLALLLVSCKTTTIQSGDESGGSLLLLISKASTPAGSFRIVVQMEHAEFPERKDSVSVLGGANTEQLHLKSIQPGTWLLSLSAKDSAGVVWYDAQALVDIQEGEVSVANVSLDVSMGGLEVVIAWPIVTVDLLAYANNPVLEQTPDGFDADYFFFHDPKVLKVNGVYRMWYSSGYNEATQGTNLNWIIYATSSDGINWEKQGPVLNPGPLGSFYEKGPALAAVLYDEGIYKMWFVANSAAAYAVGIAYAESNDGISWTVDPELVIESDVSKPQPRWPEVIKKEGVYYLYYGLGPGTTGIIEVYLMTSTDGEQWTDRGKVLGKRLGVSWETQGVVAPGVFVEQGKFRMFYTGLGAGEHSIGYAESIDGVQWLNRSAEPVLVPSQASPWQITYASHPTVMWDDGALKMWFSGLSQSPYRWEIGYAEQQ